MLIIGNVVLDNGIGIKHLAIITLNTPWHTEFQSKVRVISSNTHMG